MMEPFTVETRNLSLEFLLGLFFVFLQSPGVFFFLGVCRLVQFTTSL